MSTDIESRLRAALEARAEMVTVEALAPPSPGAGRPRPWWRSESGMLFIAAVCVIVLAIPVLAMGLARELPRQDAGPDDGPSAGSDVSGSDPTGATDSPATLSTPLTGDVDGDGKDDVVRLASGGDLPEGVTEVQAELTQRGTQAWTSEPGQDPELARLADVDGEPGAEIFVDLGSGPAGLVVLTVGESQLSTIHRSDVALGLDQAGLLHGWWVSGSRLRTSVSTEKVPPGAETYAVEATEWRPGDGELLVATPLGRWCVRASDPERLLECEAASADPSPEPSADPSAEPTAAPTTEPTCVPIFEEVSDLYQNGGCPLEASQRWWEHPAEGLPTFRPGGRGRWSMPYPEDWVGDGTDDELIVDGATFIYRPDGNPELDETVQLPWADGHLSPSDTPLNLAGDIPAAVVGRWDARGYELLDLVVVVREAGKLVVLVPDESQVAMGSSGYDPRDIGGVPAYETVMDFADGAALLTWVYPDPEGIWVIPRKFGDRLYPARIYEWVRSGGRLVPQLVGQGCVEGQMDLVGGGGTYGVQVYECPAE